MDKKALNHPVATAIRVEYNSNSDSVFLVFEIIDEKFKKKIKENWMEDIELILLNKELFIE